MTPEQYHGERESILRRMDRAELDSYCAHRLLEDLEDLDANWERREPSFDAGEIGFIGFV